MGQLVGGQGVGAEDEEFPHTSFSPPPPTAKPELGRCTRQREHSWLQPGAAQQWPPAQRVCKSSRCLTCKGEPGQDQQRKRGAPLVLWGLGGGEKGDNSKENDLRVGSAPVATKRQTNNQNLPVQRTGGQKEVGSPVAPCCTRKATPRAQQKAYWHPGTCPEETVREDVGILGWGGGGMTWVGVAMTAASNCSRGKVHRIGRLSSG